jgi:hypothetical protein
MPAGAKWAWLGEDVVRVARNDGCFGERLRLPPRWAKSYLLVASQFPSTLANQLDGGDQGADMAVEVVEAPGALPRWNRIRTRYRSYSNLEGGEPHTIGSDQSPWPRIIKHQALWANSDSADFFQWL